MKEKLNTRRRITLRQLRALTAIVRRGTLTAAADDLGVTPPAVSLQLRELEEVFRVALIERTSAGVRCTEAGREVLASADRIEAALAECVEAVAFLRDAEGGRITVGIVSPAGYFAPRALTAFKRAHPRIEMRVLVGNREETLAGLERFELDLAVTGRPPQHFPIEQAVIGENPHVVIAPPDHPLARRRKLALAQLVGEDFLMREPGSGTRMLAERLFAEAGLHPTVGMEIDSSETVKQAVMAGMGIALVSAHTIGPELESRRLVVLDIAGLPIMRQWFVIKRSEKRLLPAAQALWDHLAHAGRDYLPDTTRVLTKTRKSIG